MRHIGQEIRLILYIHLRPADLLPESLDLCPLAGIFPEPEQICLLIPWKRNAQLIPGILSI